MYYSVYKTTNLVTNEYYVGVHKTPDLNDRYFGSGTLISLSIQKYGKKNFRKEILFIFENESDAYLKEGQIVDEKMIADPRCLNVRTGGLWNQGIKEELRKKMRERNLGKKHSDETRKKMSAAHQRNRGFPRYYSPEKREELKFRNRKSAQGFTWITKDKINLRRRKTEIDPYLVEGWKVGRWIKDPAPRKVRTIYKHSPDTLKKMRESHLGKTLTEEHKAKLRILTETERIERSRRTSKSNLGTCYISKDGLNSKVRSEDLNHWLSEGWVLGLSKEGIKVEILTWYKEHGRLPSSYSKDPVEKRLGRFRDSYQSKTSTSYDPEFREWTRTVRAGSSL